MNKLRDNTGVVLWILVFAFGVIWVLQDSGGLDTIGRPTGNIAVVNGSAISYEEYQRSLEQQRQRLRQQFGSDMSAAQQDALQDQTYEQLVNAEVLRQEMDRLGIRVTDDEVENLFYGDNPHPAVRQLFSDSTGQVDRQLISNLAQNPGAFQQSVGISLREFEDYLREQRRQQKMNALVGATVHVSEQDIESAYQRRNTSVDTRYVSVRYATVPDDSINVTESDLRAYYDENREDFKQPKTYTLQYVTRSKQATAQDTAAVVNDLNGLRDEFAAAENDSLFLSDNDSRREYTSAYFSPDELETEIANAVYEDLNAGRVVGPIFAGGNAHLVKITGVQPSENTYVRASHILMRGDNAEEQAQQLRDSLQAGVDFATLAREYSADPGSASQGGDLGWFGRGRMAEAFEDAAFGASEGEVVGPVETQFGAHLIRVEAKTSQQVQLADLALSLRPSIATLDEAERQLEDVAYYAEESGDFAAEAERLNMNAQTVEVEDGQQTIPGIGSSRTITNFLARAEEGATSDIIELDDQFVVLHVAGIQEEGYRSFENVQSEIRPRVELDKKRAIITRQMRRALQGGASLEAVANELNTRVRTSTGVDYSTTSAPGIGRDRAFAGAALGLNAGEKSGLVEGENAAFVLEVTTRNEPDALTDAERQQLRDQLLQQRRRAVTSQWLSALRDQADIEDNRVQFQQ